MQLVHPAPWRMKMTSADWKTVFDANGKEVDFSDPDVRQFICKTVNKVVARIERGQLIDDGRTVGDILRDRRLSVRVLNGLRNETLYGTELSDKTKLCDLYQKPNSFFLRWPNFGLVSLKELLSYIETTTGEK